MRIWVLLFCAGILGGCATNGDKSKPPPLQSEYSDMPWNTPQPGEGQGAFGGIFNQQQR